MLIATFGPSTGWVGKTITFENEQFILEGHGAITAQDVAEYDRQGHLVWPYDEMREWLHGRAAADVAAAAPTPSKVNTDRAAIRGRIGTLHLGAWWLSTFTEEERAYIEQKYDPTREKGLTQGDVDPGQSPTAFLTLFSVWLTGPDGRPLAERVLQKADSLAGSSVLDRHFVYSEMIKAFYGQRETEPGALDAAIAACERQIAIAPQAWAAFVAESDERDRHHAEWTGKYMSSFVAPSHRGYQQLAIIREKQGDYSEALRLCREAQAQGWRDSKSDWSKRIARLESKLGKAG